MVMGTDRSIQIIEGASFLTKLGKSKWILTLTDIRNLPVNGYSSGSNNPLPK